MSDGILSDLIGERVRATQRKSSAGGYYLDDFGDEPIEGTVRAIVHSPLSLIIETDTGGISARSFMANVFTKIVKPIPQIDLGTFEKWRAQTTVRNLRVGDAFRFKKPPPGWTSGNILVVNSMPGYAAPEGWDYMPISLLNGEIELIQDKPVERPLFERVHGDEPHEIRWRTLYINADIEECLGCTWQRRRAGDTYQYRESPTADWQSYTQHP